MRIWHDDIRADSRFAISEWETALLCNNISGHKPRISPKTVVAYLCKSGCKVLFIRKKVSNTGYSDLNLYMWNIHKYENHVLMQNKCNYNASAIELYLVCIKTSICMVILKQNMYNSFQNYIFSITYAIGVYSWVIRQDCAGVPSTIYFAPSQWETAWQSNAVSHQLCANLESALYNHSHSIAILCWPLWKIRVVVQITSWRAQSACQLAQFQNTDCSTLQQPPTGKFIVYLRECNKWCRS